jgi:hypothetical protein
MLSLSKVATEELKVLFWKKTGARDFALTDEMNSVLKTEVEIKLPPLKGRTPRLAERLTFGVDQSMYNLKLILFIFF